MKKKPNVLKWLSFLTISIFSSSYLSGGTPIIDNGLIKQYMSGTYTSDVHVYAHNLVIITSTVKMAQGTKIVVHPGGNLYMGPSGILTQEHDNFSTPISTLWHGIIVLGDPSKNQDHDVSRICQMMVPCATGEYAGGGTECIGHHDQGIFYSNGGTIRYANVGVSVGDEMNPYEYGASDYIPSGSQAGGIIYIKNSTFYNCKRASITFAAYTDAFQQSLIENNTFIYDFKTVVGLTESTERFIYAYGNNFKHPISSNGFYNKMDLPTDLYFNHAVQTGNSHIILDDNYFEGDNLGAQVHAFDFMSAPFATTRYYSNEFKTRISESIGLNSVDNCWITSNAINTVDYGRGIHSFKAKTLI